MSTSILMNTCAVCGAEESLDALLLRMIDDDQVRRLIADVLTASLPLGGLVVRYLRLHKPPKQKLRMSVVGKVLAELVPDMQRGVIERTGRRWSVSHDHWRDAIQAVFDAQHKGTLSVPLQGNGYLYQVLMRLVDQAEAKAETQAEADKRSPPRNDTVTVKGQTMTIGQGLAQVYGGRDPELAKRDNDLRNAAPISDAVRAEIARVRGTPVTPSTSGEKA